MMFLSTFSDAASINNNSNIIPTSYHVICIWDSIAYIGYIAMTLVTYMSNFVPFLSDLASHGKTRSSSATTTTVTGVGNTNSNASSVVSASSSYIQWFNDKLVIKKKHFRQFYVIGLCCLTYTIYIGSQMKLTMNSFEQHHQQQESDRMLTFSPYTATLQRMSIVLLYIHMIRRFYECIYVHVWKDTSTMHIAGYFVGLIHYIWLPHIFIQLPCTQCCIVSQSNTYPILSYLHYHSIYFLQQAKLTSTTTTTTSSSSSSSAATTTTLYIGAILLCLYGQYQQYRHHVLLANLRWNKNTNDSTTTTTKKHDDHDKDTTTTTTIKSTSNNTYTLPTGGWFQYVTCPHYFAEILIYISFGILLDIEQRRQTLFNNYDADMLYYSSYNDYRHVLLVIWVASNLILSASLNYQYYEKHLSISIMKHKKAIIPFIY